MESLSDPFVRTVLQQIEDASPGSYVVGGAVRDLVLGRGPGRDIDVAVAGDGFILARDIAGRHGRAGMAFVPLDRSTGTARLVLAGPQPVTLDVSSFKGPTIGDDLSRRDFTINAVALPLSDFLTGGHECLLDPTGGLVDLDGHVVRACSERSFQDDPLRILRAFRFSTCLDFTVAPETSALMSESLPDLPGVSGERIRDELMTILSAKRPVADILRAMDRAGVPEVLFPEIVPMKGCTQNDYHHLDVWGHTLETLARLDEPAAEPARVFAHLKERIENYCGNEPVEGRSRLGLLRLAALFHDAGKPESRSVDGQGRVHFYGHEKMSAAVFAEAGNRLKLASRELRMVDALIRGHMRMQAFTGRNISKRSIYRLRRDFREDFTGLCLLFLADLQASRGPARRRGEAEEVVQRIRRALEEFFAEEELVPRKPLLNGRDLMSLFGLPEGPELGKLLRKLAELEGVGEITSREEAVLAAEAVIRRNRAASGSHT